MGAPTHYRSYGRNNMARYRGLRAIAGMRNVKVRRSIDLRELSDFGAITSSGDDLPTAGAKVDTQDMGSIATTASSDLGYNDEPYGY